MASTSSVKVSFVLSDKASSKINKISTSFEKMNKMMRDTDATLKMLDKTLITLTKSLTDINEPMKLAIKSFRSFSKVIDKMGDNIRMNAGHLNNFTNNLQKQAASMKTVSETNKSYNKVLKNSGKEYKQTGLQTNKFSKEVSSLSPRLSKNMGALGGVAVKLNAMTAGISLAISGFKQFGKFIGDSIKSFMEFEVSLVNVGNLLRLSGQEVDAWEKRIFGLGERSKFTNVQIANTVAELAKMGKSSGEIDDMIDSVVDLATAANITLEQAGSNIVKLMNSYGFATDQAEELGDKMMLISLRSSFSVEQLGAAAGKVGGVMTSMNQTFEQTAAAAQILKDQGLSAGLSFSKLQQALQRVAAPTVAADKAIESLGTTSTKLFRDASGNIREFGAIVNDMNTLFQEQGTTLEEQSKILKDVFGARSISTFSILSQNMDKYQDNLRALMDPAEYEGLVKQQAEAFAQTLEGRVQQLISTFDTFKTKVGKELQDVAKDAVDFAKEFIGSLDPVIQFFKEFGTVLFDTLQQFKTAFDETIGATGGGFEAIGNTIITIFQDIMPVIIEAGVEAFKILDVFIQLGVIIFDTLTPIFNTIVESAGQILAAIEPVLRTILQIVDVLAADLLSAILPPIQEILGVIVGIFENIFSQIGMIIEESKPLITVIFSQLRDVLSMIGGVLARLAEAIMPIITNLFTMIFDVVQRMMPLIQNMFTRFSSLAETVMPLIEDIFKTIFDVINELMPIVDMILDFMMDMNEALEPIRDMIFNLVKSLLPIGVNLFKTIGNILKTILPIVKNILGVVMNIIKTITNIVSAIPNLIGGLSAGMDQLSGKTQQGFLKPMKEVANIIQGMGKKTAAFENQKRLLEMNGDMEGSLQLQIKYYSDLLKESKKMGASTEKRISIASDLLQVQIQNFDLQENKIKDVMKLEQLRLKNEGAGEDVLNKKRLAGIEDLIALKKEEIATVGDSIERQTELAELEAERIEISKTFEVTLEAVINEDPLIQELIRLEEEYELIFNQAGKLVDDMATKYVEKYDLMSKELEKFVDLEQKIAQQREKIYDKLQKDITKQQEKVLQQEMKVAEFREQFLDKIAAQRAKVTQQLEEENKKINELLKVEGTIKKSELESIIGELGLDETFTAEVDLSKQVFSQFKDSQKSMDQAMQFIEKIYPDKMEQIFGRIEKAAQEERDKLFGQYLSDEELFFFKDSESRLEQIKQKYQEDPAKLDAILGNLQSKIDAAQLDVVQEIVKGIDIIDDTSVGKLEKKLDDLNNVNIENDKTYQKLNKDLEDYRGELKKLNDPATYQGMLAQDETLRRLNQSYSEMAGNLQFLQAQNIDMIEGFKDATPRLEEYQEQLMSFITADFTDSNIGNNAELLERFTSAFSEQVSKLEESSGGLASVNSEIATMNTGLGTLLGTLDKKDKAMTEIDISVTPETETNLKRLEFGLQGVQTFTKGVNESLTDTLEGTTEIGESIAGWEPTGLDDNLITIQDKFTEMGADISNWTPANLGETFKTLLGESTEIKDNLEGIDIEANFSTIIDTFSKSNIEDAFSGLTEDGGVFSKGYIQDLFTDIQIVGGALAETLVEAWADASERTRTIKQITDPRDLQAIFDFIQREDITFQDKQLMIQLQIARLLSNIDDNMVSFIKAWADVNNTTVAAAAYAFAQGGIVKGTPSKLAPNNYDNIHAWVHENEFIFREKSAKSIGYNNLDFMNRTGQKPAFDLDSKVSQIHKDKQTDIMSEVRKRNKRKNLAKKKLLAKKENVKSNVNIYLDNLKRKEAVTKQELYNLIETIYVED